MSRNRIGSRFESHRHEVVQRGEGIAEHLTELGALVWHVVPVDTIESRVDVAGIENAGLPPLVRRSARLGIDCLDDEYERSEATEVDRLQHVTLGPLDVDFQGLDRRVRVLLEDGIETPAPDAFANDSTARRQRGGIEREERGELGGGTTDPEVSTPPPECRPQGEGSRRAGARTRAGRTPARARC